MFKTGSKKQLGTACQFRLINTINAIIISKLKRFQTYSIDDLFCISFIRATNKPKNTVKPQKCRGVTG